MTVQFPAPGAAASAAAPGFPVYSPDPNRNETPDPLASLRSHEQKHQKAEPERELLFTIGKVKVYAPADEDIPPNLGFKMIRDIRRHGPMIAAANMMGELLGDEALDALADIPAGSVTEEDWSVMMDILGEKVFAKFQGIPGAGGKG